MMDRESMPIWVLAETQTGKTLDVSLELIGKARELADGLGVPVGALLFGENIAERSQQMISAGADRIYLGDDPQFDPYHAEVWSETIYGLVQTHQPQILLIGSTYMGRELAPILAARLQTGLTAHCIDFTLDEDGILEQHIPAYDGLMTITCPQKRPQMATVARGVFQKPVIDAQRKGEIINVDVPKGIEIRVKTLDVLRRETEGVPLESAAIIVAGGAGAGNTEGWDEIVELGSVLNAAVGSTRPAVDEGWTTLDTMIGQSGKMVSPELYIGIGLSGEQQHMVGIVGAKVMVAINNDPKSPVFDQVDLGVVEDCRTFVPILIEKIKNYKKR